MGLRAARARRGPGLGAFERYLTLWVFLCIGAGILLGRVAPEAARYLDSLAIYVGGAPVVSIPIAIALFFMMYPIMVKIDFGEVLRAGKNAKPVLLTLIVTRGIKPFTMFGIATLFLGLLPGSEVLKDGTQVELLRSYISGTLLLSIAVYVALPLVAGYRTRKSVVGQMGEAWFRGRFVPWLTPVSVTALLLTLVLLFTFKGETIVQNPLTILWIAIPLFLQTWLIFGLTYGLARLLWFRYEDAAPSAMIGASNHFEVAIATATMLYGLSSGAALATVVGVLIEVPVMLMLVRVCLRTCGWFAAEDRVAPEVA
ncbi:arsenical-resistance protein [Candidatus Bipolaricaulota bacterium]|nr:arsenical-resistance protein [Candidatus Bipolaricaulota bacterium]